MKVVLIIVVSIFVLISLTGMISAAVFGRKKNRRAHAIILLSQLPEKLTEKMISIWLAHKSNDVVEINNIVGSIGSDTLSPLFKLLDSRNRPQEFSSGKFGDNLSWTVMENALQDRGYTINSSKIVTGIVFYDLDIVLTEINKKKRK